MVSLMLRLQNTAELVILNMNNFQNIISGTASDGSVNSGNLAMHMNLVRYILN